MHIQSDDIKLSHSIFRYYQENYFDCRNKRERIYNYCQMNDRYPVIVNLILNRPINVIK